ncbi:MAG: NADH-quinone oxidoreductase subunit NuoF [Planctomycetota bacterium]
MKPFQSIDDLRQAQEELKSRPTAETIVRICSTGCRALGALDVCRAIEEQVAKRGLGRKVEIVRTGCIGLCAGAVVMVIDPKGIFYRGVTAKDAAEIVETTIEKGEIVERLCWSSDDGPVPLRKDIPFYKNQTRLVLRNCGVIDPKSLSDALAHGAYSAAAKALSEMSPESVIDEVSKSGLRGRGGAGFPTGKKWQFARGAKGQPKYLVCNADEGDPGAFMDRAVLEGDPHLVIEGMIIAAYAIGSAKGFVYVRDEYPIAVEHTDHALKEAHGVGLLGKNILGSGFDFDIEIRRGAGAFVCGEETALMMSIEGRRGMPRSRPPFPAVSGLWGKPTTINNVETLANVPRIISEGAASYASVGTAGSKGTKIFALAGKVVNTGLVEVPMGATMRQIVFEIGGGIPNGRPFKAAQVGGPSGGCVPAEHLDLPMDYDSLQKVGAIMGSGGLIVTDEDTCVVDIARFFTDFVQKESCGKCVPCRVGTRQELEILTRITEGGGEDGDIEKLDKLAQMIKASSLCGLGQTAPNPVLSTIRYYRDEYEAHVKEKRCPAGVCQALISYVIDELKCTGCGACLKACPANAISGEKKKPHAIDKTVCIKCGICKTTCKFEAVMVK